MTSRILRGSIELAAIAARRPATKSEEWGNRIRAQLWQIKNNDARGSINCLTQMLQSAPGTLTQTQKKSLEYTFTPDKAPNQSLQFIQPRLSKNIHRLLELDPYLKEVIVKVDDQRFRIELRDDGPASPA